MEHMILIEGENLTQAFSSIIDAYLYRAKAKAKHYERNLDILKKRFGLYESEIYSREDIGEYYDITRERVSRIEKGIINDMNLFLSGHLKIKKIEIAKNLIADYVDLKEKIEQSGFLALQSEIDSLMIAKFGENLRKGELCFLMRILGYVELPQKVNGFKGEIRKSWCKKEYYKGKKIEAIFQSINMIFSCPDMVSRFELIVAAKKKAKMKISNEDLEIALLAIADIEVVDNGLQLRFNKLKTIDKAYRVLRDNNRPMHFSEIVKNINLLNKESKQANELNVKNQFVTDPRFRPIGKSGKWGLSTFDDHRNLTIVEAIEKIFHESGKPLHIKEIISAVSRIRPDTLGNSIETYLNSEKSLFIRIERGVFALKIWRMKSNIKTREIHPVPNDVFYSHLKSILMKKNPIPLPEVLSYMMKDVKLNRNTIYQKIKSIRGIGLRAVVGEKYKEVFCSDLTQLDSIGEKRVLLRDKIQEEIRSVLYWQPNIPIKKGELYKKIEKNIPCKKTTFYSYLSIMEDIKEYKENNCYYAVYLNEKHD